MLVLTRRSEQSIVFPELDVTVQILRVRGNVVKVGITAPDAVTVLRKEVLDDPSHPVPPGRRNTLMHDLANIVNKAMLHLSLFAKRVEKGLVEDFDTEFRAVASELRAASKLVTPGAGDPRERIPANSAEASLRALLVEDDVNQSELLSGYLRLTGFEVDVAPDGAIALDWLETRRRPDVVLLDMHLPRVDGSETIDRIRENPGLRDLKVFAISGTSPREFGVPEGPGGVDRWFPKPLDPESLVSALQAELRSVTA